MVIFIYDHLLLGKDIDLLRDEAIDILSNPHVKTDFVYRFLMDNSDGITVDAEVSIDESDESDNIRYLNTIFDDIKINESIYKNKIDNLLINWNIERRENIGIAICYIAISEINNSLNKAVAINEAMLISKRYLDDNSSYINAIIDKI